MNNKIVVEISARHVHVSREDLDILFGKGHELTWKRDLSQPGQFLSEERVRLRGPKSEFPSVSILGPIRPATQVELSLTDARAIGVTAPVRESGDIAASGGVEIIGPAGSIKLSTGVIAPKRHIHVTPDEAKALGIADKEIVCVRVGGERGLIFGEVVVRVSAKFFSRMHIDTDEANAAGMTGEAEGQIVKC